MPNRDFFTSRGAYVNLRCYTLIRLEISRRTRWWCLKSVIVYLARDIPAFVMYCINGESGSSILIESTDSMILYRALSPETQLYTTTCYNFTTPTTKLTSATIKTQEKCSIEQDLLHVTTKNIACTKINT